MARFPNVKHDETHDGNAAIQVFGRRFFKEQTPIEYLAEFFLVFSSAKDTPSTYAFSFPIYDQRPSASLNYYPSYRLSLKLFSFLGASKLETRHPVHIQAFRAGVAALEKRIDPNSAVPRKSGVRLIQGLFSGFVGVAGDRTWTAHTFLPASSSLLAREIMWKHGGTNGAATRPDLEWEEDSAWKYFDPYSHSFMARGGELLYLQLLNLFNSQTISHVLKPFNENDSDAYAHFIPETSLVDLRDRLATQLALLLKNNDQAIGTLGSFVAECFYDTGINGEPSEPKAAIMGWVPVETATEAFLFAWEIENICKAERNALQKISLLKDLCVLHVMRSLCFQSSRALQHPVLKGFAGGYSWIVSAPIEKNNENNKKLATNAYDEVEGLLFRVLRKLDQYESESVPSDETERERWLDQGDEQTLKLFRKIGKEVGAIVPKKGAGMRLTLPAHLVRLLVAALIPPGERLRLDSFYQRIFAHFGIAINQEFVERGLWAYGMQREANSFTVDSTWFEEELRRGGYLVPLSDAIALVQNPYKG